MPKPKSIDIDTARKQLADDSRTDPFVPTARWYPSRDDRVLRLMVLAKQCAAHRDDGDEWALLEGRAWLEVGHTDGGRSCKKAISALESMREPTIDSLRWRAHAGAMGALAGNAKGAWEKTAALYRDVLARAPDDASANLMIAECARRHVQYSLAGTSKMAKVGVPLLEEALRHLAVPVLRDQPLADSERGLVFALMGRHGESVDALQRADAALAASTDLPNVWYEARMVLMRGLVAADRADDAVALVRSASVDHDSLRYQLGLRLVQAQRWAPLTRLYEGELALRADELRYLAIALNHQQRFTDSVAAIERWRRENDTDDANDPHVLHTLAIAKHGLGEHDAAKSLLREAYTRGATPAAADAKSWYGEQLDNPASVVTATPLPAASHGGKGESTIDKSGPYWRGKSHEDLHEYLTLLTADDEDPATDIVRAVCACGGTVFSLRCANDQRAAERKCLDCKKRHLIGDSEKRWEATRPAPVKCGCGGKDYDVVVAFAIPSQMGGNAITIGERCVACGVLASCARWNIADTTKDALLKSV